MLGTSTRLSDSLISLVAVGTVSGQTSRSGRFFLHQSLILPIALKLGSKTQAWFLEREGSLPRNAHKGKGAPLWNTLSFHGPLRDGVVAPTSPAGWNGERPILSAILLFPSQ